MDIGSMKIKRFRSLSFKLTIWYIAILAIIIGLAGLFLYQGFKESLMDDLDEDLLEIASDVYGFWYHRRGVQWEEAIKKAEDKFNNHRPFIQIVELAEYKNRKIHKVERGSQVKEGSFMLETEIYYRADRADIDDLVYTTCNREALSPYPVRILLFPIRGPSLVQVGISLENTTGDLRRLLLILLLAGPAVLLLASVGGSIIIRKALRPVKSVVKTAEEISADDLSSRIEPGKRKDEIGALVNTFNNMIARLEKSVGKIKQFSGDVSHELRTPLTIIRGEIEVLLRKKRSQEDYRKTLMSVLEETYQMEKIIDDLLFLSRLEALSTAQFAQEIQLDDILLRVFESREPAAKKKDIKYVLNEVISAQIKGDQTLIERLITNIIDNAIRYTPSGGEVEVSLEKKEQSACLKIHDTGIGIPQESLPLLFDRFYVVDKSRSKESGGSGLGLSIVKWIADSHEALIGIDSEVGRGTTFRFEFPLA